MTVGLALVLALVIGLVAGYRGGRIDYLLMRGADAGLAFPPLVLALAVVAVLGTGVGDVALALALVFAPGFARFIRGQTLAVKEESFVEASQSIGTPPAADRGLPGAAQRDDRPGGPDRHRLGRGAVGRVGSGLLGSRPPAAGGRLGLDAERGLRQLLVHPPLVARPGRSDHRAHRAGLQHHRRRLARHPQRHGGHGQAPPWGPPPARPHRGGPPDRSPPSPPAPAPSR